MRWKGIQVLPKAYFLRGLISNSGLSVVDLVRPSPVVDNTDHQTSFTALAEEGAAGGVHVGKGIRVLPKGYLP